MRNRLISIGVAMVIVLATCWWLSRPFLFLSGEQGIITAVPVYDKLPIQINFIHSVQKTPVEENLFTDKDTTEIILQSTRYHSFGVGLPYMDTDGTFSRDEDTFVMDNMNRRFKNLSLRTGVGTQLTVQIDQQLFKLYEQYPPGYQVDIFVAPQYHKLLLWLQ